MTSARRRRWERRRVRACASSARLRACRRCASSARARIAPVCGSSPPPSRSSSISLFTSLSNSSSEASLRMTWSARRSFSAWSSCRSSRPARPAWPRSRRRASRISSSATTATVASNASSIAASKSSGTSTTAIVDLGAEPLAPFEHVRADAGWVTLSSQASSSRSSKTISPTLSRSTFPSGAISLPQRSTSVRATCRPRGCRGRPGRSTGWPRRAARRRPALRTYPPRCPR